MSELLNALNPNAVQNRSRARTTYTHSYYQAAAPTPPQPPQTYAPHRSELEGAFNTPTPTATHISSPNVVPVPQSAPQPGKSDQFTQILRLLTESKEEAERERQRRLEWEKEQEAKYLKREEELEKQMSSMKEEISSLKDFITIQSPHPLSNTASGVSTPASFYPPTFPTLEQPYYPSAETPISHASQSPYAGSPAFIQGSSRHPIIVPTSMPVTPVAVFSPVPFMTHATSTPLAQTPTSFEPPPHDVPPPNIPDISIMSPTASPHFPPAPTNAPASVSASDLNLNGDAIRRKRPSGPESDGDETGNEKSKSPMAGRPPKRINGHDNRLLTIHAAMRAQILRSMRLKSDRNLPDSHVEGQPLPDDSPVRFIWEKTPKGSAHNAEMKTRVLKELKENRRSYPDIPEQDFNEKTIDAAFEQVFFTFRQKFKTQRDESVAVRTKQREDQKALKSRRAKRKRTKIATRTEMRGKLDTFSHETFDPAMQPECMSSEESCDEYTEPSGTGGARTKVQVLRIRGLPWRSSRLLRFYAILDDAWKLEEDRGTKQKRPSARKERCPGPPKDSLQFPPKGIADWMLSRRWLKEMRTEQPGLAEEILRLAVHPPGFDWSKFDLLGVETEEESEPEPYIPRSEVSSLANALAPPTGR